MSHLRKDIALLQLDGEVQLSDKVNTVCLPPKGSRIPPGTECFITGKFAYGLEKIMVIVFVSFIFVNLVSRI